MLPIVVQAACVFVYCLLLAWLEVQIEGEHGWAAKLPTWRGRPAWARHDSLFFRALGAGFRFMSGGNELTGYHLAMISFVFCSMMLPLALTPFSPALLWRCLGFFFVTLVTWDFLWFVINPAYGVRRFHKQAIKWHPRWIGPVPASYPFGFVFGSVLIALGSATHGLFDYVAAPVVELVLTGACVVVVEALPRRSA
jgi:hypothetical protein